ncbi:hypothetical protein V5P93_006937 [Actinokineospora auranticolor]|uniref:Uncharacterized protein n=1 Tax=Actinokineospora auranticolor TaxID=155976 RepID=A0A2S6GW90_9PSEU|nr:hypothetical protein [Actinokineospora auranticolor]PPK69421.1 hypothetical protein CLV40_10327 [Actinokineospora auranticolor]
MTEPSPTAENPAGSTRPFAVTGALGAALLGAVLAAVLLLLADRQPSWYFGCGTGISAVGALLLAWPLHAGRGWARWGLIATALVGALCAPAAANGLTASAAPYLGGLLIAVWVLVVTLLSRLDARTYFAALPDAGA